MHPLGEQAGELALRCPISRCTHALILCVWPPSCATGRAGREVGGGVWGFRHGCRLPQLQPGCVASSAGPEPPPPLAPCRLAASPCGKLVAGYAQDGTVHVWTSGMCSQAVSLVNLTSFREC